MTGGFSFSCRPPAILTLLPDLRQGYKDKPKTKRTHFGIFSRYQIIMPACDSVSLSSWTMLYRTAAAAAAVAHESSADVHHDRSRFMMSSSSVRVQPAIVVL